MGMRVRMSCVHNFASIYNTILITLQINLFSQFILKNQIKCINFMYLVGVCRKLTDPPNPTQPNPPIFNIYLIIFFLKKISYRALIYIYIYI